MLGNGGRVCPLLSECPNLPILSSRAKAENTGFVSPISTVSTPPQNRVQTLHNYLFGSLLKCIAWGDCMSQSIELPTLAQVMNSVCDFELLAVLTA